MRKKGDICSRRVCKLKRFYMYSMIMLMFVCGSAFFFLSPHLAPFLLCCTPVSVHDPRRACAARVTVVGLCVCLSVCLSTTILALQATRRLMSDTNSFSATRA